MKRLHLHIALPVAMLAAAGTAYAQQGPKPEDEIRYRQSVMNVIGRAMGPMGAMAQGKAPWDAQAAAANMVVVSAVHTLPFTGFGPGTDKGGDTRALPEVWSKPADFKAAADKMQDAMGKLDAAVKTGSLDNVKAAFGPVGGACKNCHDNFRSK